MKDSPAIIERIRRLNANYQQLDLAIEDESLRQIRPGQSLLARLVPPHAEEDTWDPYLREQWWCVGTTASGALIVERPATSEYTPGQIVSVLGPIGSPYRFRRSLRNVLLIAYDTEPIPLTITAPLLKKHNISTTLVLLGKARDYDTTHLDEEIEIITGDGNLNWDEMVMTLGWADQVFVVVGQDDEMMRFAEVVRIITERRNHIPDNYLFGVFQPIQPCGIGACMACMIRTKEGLQAVCTKGPAFDLKQVLLNAF